MAGKIAGVDTHVLQAALAAYTDEAYTEAKTLMGTGIVSDNPMLDPKTETFVGQARWFKPINPKINVASLTNAADGQLSSYDSEYLKYVKTVRNYGAKKVNMADVVTQDDGLAKIARDLMQPRITDMRNALMAVLKGVAMNEVLHGAGQGSGTTGMGGQTFENDPTDARFGFYVDLGTNKLVSDASPANQGAQRAEAFLKALGMGFKDYEPEYAYLVTSPEVMASLRAANLVDQTKITDGQLDFDTIFQGKLRLVQTRASQGFKTAEITALNGGSGLDLVGTKTSYLILPGAIAHKDLVVPEPVEIARNATAYQGGGTTTIMYRWGYILAPVGYSWEGDEETFPTDEDYYKVKESSTFKKVESATSVDACRGVWQRKASSALSLGILPIFHG